MDCVPQASGVFISGVQPVAQVIPGIKGYAGISAASFPLVEGLKPSPPLPSLSLLMKTESYVLLYDSFLIHLSLIEDALLYSLPEANFSVISIVICCSCCDDDDFTSNSPQRLNIIWLQQSWTPSHAGSLPLPVP